MRASVAFVALMGLGCGDDPLPELDVQPLSVQTEAPVAGLSVPEDGTWITPGVLEGVARDDDQAASTLLVQVRSIQDGVLFYGNPEPDGRWAWSGELTPGDNPVEVSVVDREGNLTAESTLLRVRTNDAPSCRILSPLEGEVFPPRTDIRFTARVDDADGDPVDVLWQSSRDGGLARGDSFVLRLLGFGQHTISIEARDPFGGICTDAVRVRVE